MSSDRRNVLIVRISGQIRRLRVVRYHSNMDDHVVPKVLVSGDEGVSLCILEADAFCSPFVQSVEVLDRGNNGICGIVGEYLYPHRQPCSIVGRTIEQQLERNVLGCGTRRRNVVGA